MVSYDLFLFRLKIENLTRRTNFLPFLDFGRDHLPSTSEIIEAVDHLRFGDHLQCCTYNCYASFVPSNLLRASITR